MTTQTGSETAIEDCLGYLPKCERDWLWYMEGMCAGASIVLVIFAVLFYWRIV